MFKLALNAGHGLKTAGKRCLKSIDPNETREWTLNSRICNKIQAILNEYEGIEVRRFDDISGQTDIPVSKRTTLANEWGADFYLSIHHNAGINGGNGGGIETYTYTKVGDETKQWQKLLYNSIIKYTNLKGNRSSGIKTANFAECRLTSMPAVICENGYMDSVVDTPIILTDDFADKVAQGCCQVIIEKAKLKKKSKSTVSSSKNPSDNESIARQVIKGMWGNGEERKEKLTKAGYNYSVVQKMVNQLLEKSVKKSSSIKSNLQIVDEVIKGLWGNGEIRRERLTKAGYDYSKIQRLVNAKLKGE